MRALMNWVLPGAAVLLALLAAPLSAAGEGRTVLVEFFCTQGCQWAETAAQALDQVADEYGPAQVQVLEYNLDLNPALFERRFYLYVPVGTHVPFAFFDGSRLGIYGSNNDVDESYGWYRDAVEQELDEPSPLRIEAARYQAGEQNVFEVRVTNVSGQPFGPTSLLVALYEKAQVGRTHRFLRYLSPELTLDTLAAGESRTLAHTTPALPVGTDLGLVEGLAFVQQAGTNEVQQAAPAYAPWMSLSLTSLAAVVTPEDAPVGPQSVLVDGVGLAFGWSLEVPQEGWLTATPTSGARGEEFAVSLDPAGLAYGTYTATLVVRTDASVSPAESTVALTLHVAPQAHALYLPSVTCR